MDMYDWTTFLIGITALADTASPLSPARADDAVTAQKIVRGAQREDACAQALLGFMYETAAAARALTSLAI
jgi:hypothetical protein